MSGIFTSNELTNHLVSNWDEARFLLERAAAHLPERVYDEKWRGITGYFDPMVHIDLNVEEGFTSVDPVGRRLVVLPGEAGNMVYFDRYGDRKGPVVCNGFASDLAPSWAEADRACSGWRVDNDQFAEPLVRRLAA